MLHYKDGRWHMCVEKCDMSSMEKKRAVCRCGGA